MPESTMNYNSDFEIKRISFDPAGLSSVQSEYFVAENWPVVYILNDNGQKLAYVGETVDTTSRLNNHLQTEEKRRLREAHLIASKKFNKSATLDIESNLIKYLHADGQYKLLNGNLGLVNHSYYQRDEYYSDLFKNIWNGLISQGIARHSLEHITNSDLFKYSPYKSLSLDQRKNLMLIIDALLADDKKSILVEGGAGTGKTILAIFLFKLMLSDDADFNYKEFGEDEQQFINKIKQLKAKYPKPKMCLVIAMSSFRKTIQNVFSNIQGLDRKMVVGPSDLSKGKYDIVFVDEAHRLRKRVNLTNYASFDNAARDLGLVPNDTDELEWTQLQSSKALYFYDPKQSIKPSDVNPEKFQKIKASSNSKVLQLHSQFRSKGGNGYVKFVEDLLDQNLQNDKFTYKSENYDVLLFDDFKNFVSELKKKNSEHQLSRFVAGYGWKWVSKYDKSKFDIVIDGLQFHWNHDSIDFITKDANAEQIGCIHTTQGYDLNYVGLIFGPEIKLNPDTNLIEVVPENYFDTNGRNTITDIDVLKQYIINIYKTILLRGILGCYIYVCDSNLREYFRKHIPQFSNSALRVLKPSTEPQPEIIPYVNSVPLYSLKVAAGEFKFNGRPEELEFIRVPEGTRVSPDHFACQIVGNSMNKIVQDGQIALFKKYHAGSRNGLMVLAEYYDYQDADYGSCYTFKEYYSQKLVTEQGYKHERIVLKPKSFDPSYQEIEIDADAISSRQFNVIGIFERVLE
jgi:DUF2075 family protein/predicted GIY-YIG superfamily endonuclease/phage repressor protein C with HTH and peptisase S24 domain